MEKKLGVVTLEQLGQPLTYPNRPRRTPEPTQRGKSPLQVPTTNRTAIYVRNLPADQAPEQKLQDDLRRCREYCKGHALEVVIEYSDPKGTWKEFRQMMTVATGRRPPFDNVVVSNFNSRFAPYPAYNMDCRDHLRKNGVTVRSLTPSV